MREKYCNFRIVPEIEIFIMTCCNRTQYVRWKLSRADRKSRCVSDKLSVVECVLMKCSSFWRGRKIFLGRRILGLLLPIALLTRLIIWIHVLERPECFCTYLHCFLSVKWPVEVCIVLPCLNVTLSYGEIDKVLFASHPRSLTFRGLTFDALNFQAIDMFGRHSSMQIDWQLLDLQLVCVPQDFNIDDQQLYRNCPNRAKYPRSILQAQVSNCFHRYSLWTWCLLTVIRFRLRYCIMKQAVCCTHCGASVMQTSWRSFIADCHRYAKRLVLVDSSIKINQVSFLANWNWTI